MADTSPKNIVTGAKAVMKKTHACGGNLFVITRTGADVKLQCLACGHSILMDLSKAQKSIKTIILQDK